ncbi:MAG: cytochrome c oxidase assembly protein [Magnetovibrio sp.]|nr:cytochrome c oxidase assembly protein [Magnetovibrio sp.]
MLKILQRQNRNTLTAFFLFGIVLGMAGLAFSSAPLYKLFCQVTGFGGTPKTNVVRKAISKSAGVINVRFDANTNSDLPWVFKPEKQKVLVSLGEPKLAFYFAKNVGAKPVTGTASYNITPFKVAKYFSKIDCFCFVRQTLEPGKRIPMPVEFIVDPEILEDPDTAEVKTITVSYTFFPVVQNDRKKS